MQASSRSESLGGTAAIDAGSAAFASAQSRFLDLLVVAAPKVIVFGVSAKRSDTPLIDVRTPIQPNVGTKHPAACADHPRAQRAHSGVVWQPVPVERRAVMVAAAVRADVPHRHRREGLLLPLDGHDRAQSSSVSRVTAGALGFFVFTQSRERPE
jgi:hypothetical protein